MARFCYSTFTGLVTRFGYEDDLSDDTLSFTVFAPTNDAFDALKAVKEGKELFEKENENHLRQVKYRIGVIA
jgi:uncharacterized surface protein with fasciclin (FAS1) repeats